MVSDAEELAYWVPHTITYPSEVDVRQFPVRGRKIVPVKVPEKWPRSFLEAFPA